MLHPKFSFVIPSYGRVDVLRRLLEDLKEQENFELNEIEVIIINEENSEEYSKLAMEFSNYFKVLYIGIPSTERLGSSETRNIGISSAKGDFIVFLDDDVRISRDFLSKCSDLAKKYQAFSFRIQQPNDPRPQVVKKMHKLFVGKVFLPIGIIFGGFELEDYRKEIIFVDHFPGTAFVVRRDLINELRFDEYLGRGNGYLEDSDFTYALHRRGYPLVFITNYSVQHLREPKGGNRVHDPSIWLSETWLYFYWNHKAYFVKKWGGNLKLIPATFFNFLECFALSLLTRKFLFIYFIRGWFDGIRKRQRA